MDFSLFPQSSAKWMTQSALLDTNALSSAYGLVLSAPDAKMLAETEQEAISTQDRISIGSSAAVQLAQVFCRSSYLAQETYADSLAALTDVFYAAKDACCDCLNDQQIISVMFQFFETVSGGSIELLQERDMEELCRQLRNLAFFDKEVEL